MENKIIGIVGIFFAGLLRSKLIIGHGDPIADTLFVFSIVLLVIGIATTDLPQIYGLFKNREIWENDRNELQRALATKAKRPKQPNSNDSEVEAIE